MLGILLLRVLNKGIAVSWLILAIIVVRLFLKKAPKWSVCLLWALVAVRLLLPFSFVSAFSLVLSAEFVQENIDTSNAEVPRIDSGIAIVNETVNPVVERALTADEITGINKVRTAQFYLSIVWIAGASAMLLYALISFGLLKRRVRASVAIKDRVMVCDDVKSPFILGIVRPLIYVPSDMGGDTLDLVIAHETAHLKRHDHWWKPLGFVLLAIYWFNPLCWAAYVLLCRDIEAACDEKVIRDQSKEYVAAYSQALLDCSVHRRMIAACPLAFGETGVKARIKAVLNYRKPAFWIIAVALLGCIAVAVCFLTDPFPSSISSDLNSFLEKTVLDGDTIYNEDNYRCCDIKVLRSNTDGNVMTVYAWVLDEEYSYKNGEIHDESGSHFPAIFMVNIVSDGYEMADDYWIPRDGSEYVSSIHEHFPVSLWNKAVDSQRYIEEQQARCMEKARRHFQGVEGIDALESSDGTDGVARPVVNLSDTESVNANQNNPLGLTMTTMDIKPTGCILFFTQSGGNVTGQLQTGQWYEVQMQNAYGEWVDASDRDTERGWEDIAYMIKSDGTTELDLNWEDCYGWLSDGHYRIAKKVMDYRSPGDYDEYNVYAEFDIGGGIQSTENVTDWLDIDLPQGYYLSNFYDNIGYMGGSLILPRPYDADNSGSAPLEWQYSGIISRLPVESGMATVTFDNGIPNPASAPHENHTDSEYVKTIGLERSNMQWPAIMLKESHDLYTASQLGEMEEAGIDIDGKDLTSDYWVFWFVKEGEDTYYLLTLSAREFSQDEAEAIASAVVIK